MKTRFLLFALLLSSKLFAQLPPIAQALYDSAYANDPLRGQYATNNGAVPMATADGNTFYLKWFPTGGTPNSHPLLVTIHGTSGTAFDEFYLWHQYAAAKGVGIIALQWYKGYTQLPPNDYFDDIKLYEYIDTALTRIQYPSNKALFHGFSRGSAISYAVAFRDVQPPKGKNYFCTIMSNSGRPDSTYYLYNQINSGTYGHTFYNGKHWGMFCGGQDPGVQTCCAAMYNSQIWVEANNGIVGLFINDPSVGHGGFHQTPAYIDSCLNYYLPCYSTSIETHDNSQNINVTIYPNPFSSNTTIQVNKKFKNCAYSIFNAYGQKVKHVENISEQNINIKKDYFSSGIYFIQLTIDNKTITEKLVIID